MSSITITELHQKIREIENSINAQTTRSDSELDGWYEMHDIMLDGLIHTAPRDINETAILADVLKDFCQRFIGAEEQQMLVEERRMLNLVLQLQRSLHQIAAQSSAQAELDAL